MTPAERNILMFLAKNLLAELSDWTYEPPRAERRQILTHLIDIAQNEKADE